MEKIMNAIIDLKVENLKFEKKFDEKINTIIERLKALEGQIEKR